MSRARALWRRLVGGAEGPQEHPVEAARTHVVLLDGTMSSLEPGQETSIGLIYRMLRDARHDCLYYEPGLEWRGLRRAPEVMAGLGINRQIRRSYMFLSHRYRPGDRVYLIGYSRGAYAVRSLAGMVDQIGLLRDAMLTHARVREAWELYRDAPGGAAARAFRDDLCHERAPITAVAVFDTVRAVGIRWPVLWRLFPEVHAFRSHRLGGSVEHGFHAMALDETRRAYALERWETAPSDGHRVEQVWFKGGHGDVGGHISGHEWGRPQANVSAVWMLERLAEVGLDLPDGWRARFKADPDARAVGSWRGWGPLFLSRARRRVGLDASEFLHPSAVGGRADGLVPVWGASQNTSKIG